MKTLARIFVILFLQVSVAPPTLSAAPAAAAPTTGTPALPAAAQAAGATPTWWATVQVDLARAAPGIDPAGLSPTPNWTRYGGQASARLGVHPPVPAMSTVMATTICSSAPNGTITARSTKGGSTSSTVLPPA